MTGSVYRLGKGVTTDAMGQPLKEGDRVCYSIHLPLFSLSDLRAREYNICPNRRGALPPAHGLTSPAPSPTTSTSSQPLCIQGAAGAVE